MNQSVILISMWFEVFMSWYHEIEQNQDAEIGKMRALRIK